MCARPFIPVPFTASIEFIYSQAGQFVENKWYVTQANNFTNADLQVLIGDAQTYVNTHARNAYHSSMSLVRLVAKALHSPSAPVIDYALPGPIPGTRVTQALPLNVTFCMKLSTGLQGRSYRGRWYVVGLTADMLTDVGLLTAAQAGGFSTLYGYWIAALAARNQVPVVVSYRHDKAWRLQGIATQILGATFSDLALDSQRRRLPGRGRS